MQEARESVHNAVEAVCDGLRQIGDFTYAFMPKDLAHALADFEKACLAQFRSLADSQIEWIDERVAGGDRLREEWREKCRTSSTDDATSSPVA